MRTNRRNTATRALLLMAAITYSGVPWEAIVGFPLNPSRSYLSELAASDQPTSPLFRLLDGLTGALILTALTVRGRMAHATRLARAGALALAAFAVLTIIDASLPMACATSASLQCAAGDAANTLGFVHQIHAVSSASALAALIVSAVLLTIAVVKDPDRTRRGSRRMLLIVVTMLIVTTVIVSVLALLSTDAGRLVAGGGYIQRAQVVLASAYFVVYGCVIARRRFPVVDLSHPSNV